MPFILKSQPFAHLIIVGRNSNKLQPLIQELALEGNVTLTGTINFPLIVTNNNSQENKTPDWLAAIYRASELYVSAGLEEGAEGLSLAILEAMSATLPIVGTNISGNRDIIKNGENGFLVPPGDPSSLAEAILQLLSDDQTRFRMGFEAKNFSSEYGWRQIARKYVAVYQKAIDLNGGTTS